MLNKLLNEMDGLKEDADILFVLTTNRPEDARRRACGSAGPHRSGDRSAAPRRAWPRQAGPALRQGTGRSTMRSSPKRHAAARARVVHQGVDATAGTGEPGARRRQLGDVSRYRRGARRHAVLRRPAQCAIAWRRTGHGGGVDPPPSRAVRNCLWRAAEARAPPSPGRTCSAARPASGTAASRA